MTGALIPVARLRAIVNGTTMPGAKLYTYETGTTTPLATYGDSALTTANSNPLVADATGLFGPIYLQAESYTVAFKTATDVPVWSQDDVADAALLLRAELADTGGSAMIGFIQGGTGAVARTAQSKMRERVTAADFGAAGDGTTDDSAAIQAAVDYLDSGGGGTLIFGVGTFVFKMVTLCNNLRITGQGAATVLKMPDDISNGTAMFVGYGLGNLHDLEFDHFTVNGNIAGQTTKINGSGQIKSNADIGDFEQVYFADLEDVDRVHVHHIHAYNQCSDFMLFRGNYYNIHDNVIIGCGRDCFSPYGGSFQHIHHNQLSASQLCIDVEAPPGVTITNLNFSDNYCTSDSPRVSLNAANRPGLIAVVNNEAGQTINNIVIANNTCTGVEDGGVFYPAGAIEVGEVSGTATIPMVNISITGNVIIGGQTGINATMVLSSPTNGAGVSVTGNTIRDVHSSGINIGAAQVCTGNYVAGATGAVYGIRCLDSRSSVVGNRIHGFDHGIRLDNGVVKTTITGNSINGSDKGISGVGGNHDTTLAGNAVFDCATAPFDLPSGFIGAANVSPNLGRGLIFPNGVWFDSGGGDPNGVRTAPPGSQWNRDNGGTSTTLYVKESGTGNTGWVAK